MSDTPATPIWTRFAAGRHRVAVAAGASLAALTCIAMVAMTVRAARASVPVSPAIEQDGSTPPAEGDQRAQALIDLHGLRIGSRALHLISEHYVDPEKLKPREMLEQALQAVAHLVPDMLVDAPQLDAKGQPLELRVRIGEATLRLPMQDLNDVHRLGWALLQAVRFVAGHLPPDIAAARVEYTAVNGMLATLDQFSHMLDPDQWRDMQTNTGGNFGGLGIVILAQEGVLTIQSVIDGSPAQRAGLTPGDQILQIDGEDTLNMTVDEAVERLRGLVGVAARLQLRRKGWARPQEVTVVRAVIHLQSVEAKVLDNGVGYVRVKSFQRGTAEELADAVDRLQQAGSQNGLVLDLRDNPGGLLDEAIKVCDLFIASGPAVITVTGGQRQRDERPVSGQGRLRKLPLAVLINGHSASASEIVAGALKYSGRAIVLGEQSFGKASVQVPYEIGEAALKLTVAKYLVPGDINIMGVGIAPDIGIQFVSATREQVSLFGGPRYSRAIKKVRTLMSAQLAAPETSLAKPKVNLRILLPERQPAEGAEGPAEVMEREPRERAATLLRRAGDVHAAVTLANAQVDLAAMAHQDELDLVAHLRKQGIDWHEGQQTANPQLRVQIVERDGGIQVQAGDVFRMSVTLTNAGNTPLSRLHVLTRCDDPTLDGHEQLVGRLEPGQNRTVHLAVRVSMRHGNLQVPMQVAAAQDGQLLNLADETLVTVSARARPEFAFRFAVDDPAPGNGDGVLQPGEQAVLRVEVRNRGPGMSQSTVVTLRSLADARLHLDDGRVQLGTIAQGGMAVARFAVHGGDAPSGRVLPAGVVEPARAELAVLDETLGVDREERVDVPWSPLPLARLSAAAQAQIHSLRDQAAQTWDAAPAIAIADLGQDGLAPLRVVDAAIALNPGGGTAGAAGWGAMAGSGATSDARCRLELAGTAQFDLGAPKRRFVTASVGGAKQAYQAGYGQGEVAFRAALRLDTGLNTVTIQAQAGPRRVAEKQLLVHCRRPGAW